MTWQGSGALLLLCTLGVVVRAQDAPPGLSANLDITQRLEFSDNPDFEVDGASDLFGRTVLEFGLESVRNIDNFALSLGFDITEGRSGESSIDVENPFVSLAYDRETRSAATGVDFTYRESDVESDIDVDDFAFDGDVITQDSGTRQNFSFAIDAEVGRDAPIGASFSWRYNAETFSGTADPDLTDQRSNDFSTRIDFHISPRITFNLNGRYFDFDAQGNGVNRQTTGLGVGVDLEISPILTADLGLSYDRIERSGDEIGTDEGISFDVGLTRTVTNGTWGLSFASDVSSNDDGPRSSLRLEREMELARGSLTYALGVTGAGAVGTDPLIDINYTHQMRTAQFTFGLGQNVVTDDDNDERINTSLRARFDQEINNSSSYGLSFTLFDVNDLSAAEDDTRRIDLSVTYRHDLTRDWGLVGSFSHARLTEDNASDRTRNTVFVGLERSFDWSP